jgi:2-oxoglutarate ferredoxin oxidoreductase subunit beta
VIGIGGDGDGLAIGLGHFLHAARRNLDVLYILLDNNVYGLTKGQSSPTTQLDHFTKSNPFHIDGPPMNPIPLALSAGASFVARMFTGNMKEMLTVLPRAFEHKGFAFIHALSPCTVFHDTYQLYFKNVKPLPTEHSLADKFSALERGSSDSPIYSGIFYQEEKETLLERVEAIQKKQQEQPDILDIAKKWSR